MRTIQRAALLALAVLLAAPALARGGGHGGIGARSSGSGHSVRSAQTSSASAHTVRGYTTAKGTYVAPHRATNPDHTKANNWSTRGNVNPDTGKPGTKAP